MRPRASLLLVLAIGAFTTACGRRVVLDPSRVDLANDRAWTITSEPARPNAAPRPAPVVDATAPEAR